MEEVLKVGSYCDIRSEDIIPEIPAAREIFSARNQIIHEMDGRLKGDGATLE